MQFETADKVKTPIFVLGFGPPKYIKKDDNPRFGWNIVFFDVFWKRKKRLFQQPRYFPALFFCVLFVYRTSYIWYDKSESY